METGAFLAIYLLITERVAGNYSSKDNSSNPRQSSYKKYIQYGVKPDTEDDVKQHGLVEHSR